MTDKKQLEFLKKELLYMANGMWCSECDAEQYQEYAGDILINVETLVEKNNGWKDLYNIKPKDSNYVLCWLDNISDKSASKPIICSYNKELDRFDRKPYTTALCSDFIRFRKPARYKDLKNEYTGSDLEGDLGIIKYWRYIEPPKED